MSSQPPISDVISSHSPNAPTKAWNRAVRGLFQALPESLNRSAATRRRTVRLLQGRK